MSKIKWHYLPVTPTRFQPGIMISDGNYYVATSCDELTIAELEEEAIPAMIEALQRKLDETK